VNILYQILFRTYLEYITPSVLFAEQLHCPIGDIACFRNASYQDIVLAQVAINNMVTSFKLLLFFEPWVPVIDNIIVHGQLLDLVQNMSFAPKQLIIGTLTEECVFFIYQGWGNPVPPTVYAEVLLGTFQEKALKVLGRYPPDSVSDERSLLSRIATQWVFACSSRVFARKVASYSYVFAYPLDFDGWGNETYCNGHVCHGAELPFLFESAWVNFTDAGRRVSQSMATYWANFATSQDPNEPLRVTTPWPRVTSGNEKYMYFQDPLQVQENYMKEACDFWDEIGYKTDFFQIQ
jgi:carboxylesterase type B